MTKWWWVLLSGALGGAFCGFLFLLPMFLFGNVWTLADLVNLVGGALLLGALFGAPVGLVAFPICYYLLLRKVPLRISLTYTILAATCAAWIGNLTPISRLVDANSFIEIMYGFGFCGLLAASIALYLIYHRSKPSSA